ncbi:MAG: GNAT family N-acetyltransferase [Armatimonadota bacterium]
MFDERDRTALVRLWTDPQVREFLGGPASAERVEAMLSKFLTPSVGNPDRVDYALRDAECLAGVITFSPHTDGGDIEVSYLLLPEWWGRGVMRLGLLDALRVYAEERQVERVIAETQAANERSCRLLTRLKFRLDRELVRFGAEQHIYSLAMPPNELPRYLSQAW